MSAAPTPNEVTTIIDFFAPQQLLIQEQLAQIAQKRRKREGGQTGVAIPLQLDSLEAVRKTRELATARNKNIKKIFEVPENLTWLDLSFNQLSYLSREITQLYNIKIFYLHGNNFTDYSAVLPQLQSLPKLYSLTLHGNPIEERRGYKLKILTMLPRLRSLDFTNVTNSDLERIGCSRASSREPSGR